MSEITSKAFWRRAFREAQVQIVEERSREIAERRLRDRWVNFARLDSELDELLFGPPVRIINVGLRYRKEAT